MTDTATDINKVFPTSCVTDANNDDFTSVGNDVTDDSSEMGFPWWLVANVFSIVFIVLSNFVIVFLIGKTKSLQTASNLAIFSLAVANLVAGLLAVPTSMLALEMLGQLGDRSFCIAFRYLIHICRVAAVYTMVVISYDRYVAVLHPVTRLDRRTVVILLGTVWLFAMLYSTRVLFSYAQAHGDDRGLRMRVDQHNETIGRLGLSEDVVVSESQTTGSRETDKSNGKNCCLTGEQDLHDSHNDDHSKAVDNSYQDDHPNGREEDHDDSHEDNDGNVREESDVSSYKSNIKNSYKKDYEDKSKDVDYEGNSGSSHKENQNNRIRDNNHKQETKRSNERDTVEEDHAENHEENHDSGSHEEDHDSDRHEEGHDYDSLEDYDSDNHEENRDRDNHEEDHNSDRQEDHGIDTHKENRDRESHEEDQNSDRHEYDQGSDRHEEDHDYNNLEDYDSDTHEEDHDSDSHEENCDNNSLEDHGSDSHDKDHDSNGHEKSRNNDSLEKDQNSDKHEGNHGNDSLEEDHDSDSHEEEYDSDGHEDHDNDSLEEDHDSENHKDHDNDSHEEDHDSDGHEEDRNNESLKEDHDSDSHEENHDSDSHEEDHDSDDHQENHDNDGHDESHEHHGDHDHHDTHDDSNDHEDHGDHGDHAHKHDHDHHHCGMGHITVSKAFIAIDFCLLCVFPVLAMACLYLKIYSTLRAVGRFNRKQSRERRKRLLPIIFSLTTSFVLCNFPYEIVLLYIFLGRGHFQGDDDVRDVTSFLVHISFGVSAVLYAFFNDQYRRALVSHCQSLRLNKVATLVQPGQPQALIQVGHQKISSSKGRCMLIPTPVEGVIVTAVGT